MNDADNLQEQAAAWSERLNLRPSARAHAEFRDWVKNDPKRLDAFRRVNAARRTAAALAHEPEMQHFRNATLERIEMRKQTRMWRRKWIVRASLAGGTMAASVLLVMQFTTSSAPVPVVTSQQPARVSPVSPASSDTVPAKAVRVYETKVGQQRVVKLDDSTVITLDSNTRMSVNYTSGKRLISLAYGQAYFAVGYDKERPFVVTAGKSKVIALGTEFDVSITHNRLAVHLVEGRLRVEQSDSAAQAPAQIAMLAAGEKLQISSDNIISVERADALAATDWRKGRLVFDHERLGDVVTKFNRYRRQPILFDDKGLADILVSGVFETDRSDVFIEAIGSYFPIDAVTNEDGTIILRRRR